MEVVKNPASTKSSPKWDIIGEDLELVEGPFKTKTEAEARMAELQVEPAPITLDELAEGITAERLAEDVARATKAKPAKVKAPKKEKLPMPDGTPDPILAFLSLAEGARMSQTQAQKTFVQVRNETSADEALSHPDVVAARTIEDEAFAEVTRRFNIPRTQALIVESGLRRILTPQS